jgi:predicted alpha/beta superfamily hydrolase
MRHSIKILNFISKTRRKIMARSTLSLLLLFGLMLPLQAQVTFVIDSLPDYTPPEDILFIAGDFQGWNPGDPNFALEKNGDGKWFITLDAAPQGTTIQFKFTRGDWGKVEKGPNGQEIPNRTFTFGNGETVSCIIFNWADNSGGGGTSTAAENVHVMDEEFYMPQLDRYRRIWVYLPPDYEETDGSYPVIYMHDGQNLFDASTSYLGEWEVDETLNDLFEAGYHVPIVVGIDNGGMERGNEYTPWVNEEYGGGQGELYMQFIVETLKPHIDEIFRTLAGRESTAVWGSSLGGLISFYGIMAYQEVFSKAGVYSPSYWWSDTVWTFTAEAGIQDELKLYQMTGELEGGTMVPNTWAMDELLKSMGMGEDELSTTIVEEGEHNEALWRDDFEHAYLWLFHSFANAVDDRPVRKLVLYPNPAADRIRLPVTLTQTDRIVVYALQGKKIHPEGPVYGGSIDITGYAPGIYCLEVVSEDAVYRGKFVKH